MSDIGAALTQSLSKDGQTTPTANLTMGNFRLTALAAGTNRTDAVNVGQVQDNTPAVLSSIAGTGDAITASTSPAITVYATDSKFVYTPTSANTLTNPTIAIDGLAAKTITQSNGVGLWSGAFVVGTPYELLYEGTNMRVQTGQLGGQIYPTGSPFALRNKIIDGNFDFWDGGTSFAISGTSQSYTADMWLAAAGASGSATVSQFAFAPGGEAAGMETPVAFALQYQQTVASASTGGFIEHKIESVSTFENRTLTLSMWLWVTSGTLSITQVSAQQNFGSSGSTQVTTIQTVAWTITTTPQRFSVAIAVPSISGKTVAGGNDSLAVNLLLPTGSTFTLRTTQWQAEDCPANAPAAGLPTPFEYRGRALEQTMISRLFQVINISSGATVALGMVTAATTAIVMRSIQPMRATPAVTFFGSGALQIAGVSFANAAAVSSMNSPQTHLISATVSGATPGQACSALAASGTGGFFYDARL